MKDVYGDGKVRWAKWVEILDKTTIIRSQATKDELVHTNYLEIWWLLNSKLPKNSQP